MCLTLIIEALHVIVAIGIGNVQIVSDAKVDEAFDYILIEVIDFVMIE